jgi:hypothetical protein
LDFLNPLCLLSLIAHCAEESDQRIFTNSDGGASAGQMHSLISRANLDRKQVRAKRLFFARVLRRNRGSLVGRFLLPGVIRSRLTIELFQAF